MHFRDSRIGGGLLNCESCVFRQSVADRRAFRFGAHSIGMVPARLHFGSALVAAMQHSGAQHCCHNEQRVGPARNQAKQGAHCASPFNADLTPTAAPLAAIRIVICWRYWPSEPMSRWI